MTESQWWATPDPDELLESLVGKVSREALLRFVRECWQRIQPFLPPVEASYTVVEQFAEVVQVQSDLDAARYASEAAIKAAGWAPTYSVERQRQADILRHLLGNPFRPYPVPDNWPTDVLELAQALAAGRDCAFALHDALLEAGHPELGKHFAVEREHGAGCWVLELLRRSQRDGA